MADPPNTNTGPAPDAAAPAPAADAAPAAATDQVAGGEQAGPAAKPPSFAERLAQMQKKTYKNNADRLEAQFGGIGQMVGYGIGAAALLPAVFTFYGWHAAAAVVTTAAGSFLLAHVVPWLVIGYIVIWGATLLLKNKKKLKDETVVEDRLLPKGIIPGWGLVAVTLGLQVKGVIPVILSVPKMLAWTLFFVNHVLNPMTSLVLKFLPLVQLFICAEMGKIIFGMIGRYFGSQLDKAAAQQGNQPAAPQQPGRPVAPVAATTQVIPAT